MDRGRVFPGPFLIMRVLPLFLVAVSSLLAKSPAESKIEQAQSILASDPKRSDAWAEIGDAYVRRARETGHPEWLLKAEEALTHIPKTVDQYEANRVRIRVMLARQQYLPALELARSLNQRMPDELAIYGFIVQAAMALGKYDEAEKAAQWILDLRPNSPEGLLRAASLREVFGDYEGALQFLRQVYKNTPAEETEDRAWIATEIARNLTAKGDFSSAESAINNALKGFPDYYIAWERLGKLRLAQKRPADAIEPMRKWFSAKSEAAAAYYLAIALQRAGNLDEAKGAFTRFEQLAAQGGAVREHILYLADIAEQPSKALQLAKQLTESRQDVYSLDALAWAYYRNGKQSEADKVMAKVRSIGIKDPEILAHDRRISPEP